MGLEIAYRIVVNKHHGDVDLESQPGHTSFRVRLPIQAVNQSFQGVSE